MSESSDRQFINRFSILMAALAGFAVVLFVLAQVIVPSKSDAESSAGLDDKSVAQRIQPVGRLNVSATPVMDRIISSAHAANPGNGKGIYDKACASCHATGVAGAPKVGDKAAWKDRIAKGKGKLYETSLKGKPGTAMLPKGGQAQLSDADVKAAVDYMISASQ